MVTFACIKAYLEPEIMNTKLFFENTETKNFEKYKISLIVTS